MNSKKLFFRLTIFLSFVTAVTILFLLDVNIVAFKPGFIIAIVLTIIIHLIVFPKELIDSTIKELSQSKLFNDKENVKPDSYLNLKKTPSSNNAEIMPSSQGIQLDKVISENNSQISKSGELQNQSFNTDIERNTEAPNVEPEKTEELIKPTNIIKQGENEIKHGIEKNTESPNVETEKAEEGKKTANLNNKTEQVINYNNQQVSQVAHLEKESIDDGIKKSNVFIDFFADNFIAKMGGLLIFLGVLFLLYMTFGVIGNIGKIIIGFIIGFSLYGIGIFLEKKKLNYESKVLLGTGILINYLVILSGRYLLNVEGGGLFLSETITFALLIANTIFAVYTSLSRKSNVLLLFSFIFAFVNPFLVGGESNSPYLVSFYGLVIGVGAMYLFWKENNKNYYTSMFNVGFIGANILFLVAPYSDLNHWIVKLFFVLVYFLMVGFLVYKKNDKNIQYFAIIGSYIVIAISYLLSLSLDYGLEGNNYIYFSILTCLATVIVITLLIVKKQNNLKLFITSFVPLIILLFLTYNLGSMFYFYLYSMIVVILSFCVIYYILKGTITNQFTKGMFISVGVFLIFLVTHGVNSTSIADSYNDIMFLIFGVLFFVLFSYLNSKKQGLEILYSLGTTVGALCLIQLINFKDGLEIIGVIAMLIYAFFNIFLPGKYPKMIHANPKAVIMGLVIGSIFIGTQIARGGDIYFNSNIIGVMLLMLSIVYVITGFIYRTFNNIPLLSDLENPGRNLLVLYYGIALSIFSVSMSIIFSNIPGLVSVARLIEASVLFYMYSKIKDIKVYFAGIGLMLVGLLFLVFKYENTLSMYLPLIILLISLLFNIRSMKFDNSLNRKIFDFVTIGGGIIILFLTIITGSKISGLVGLASGAFVLVLFMIVSSIYKSEDIRLMSLGGFIAFIIVHVHTNILYIIGTPISNSLVFDRAENLYFINYLITIILSVGMILSYRLNNSYISKFGFLSMLVYLYIITSIYIYELFGNHIFLTIYFGMISFVLLFYGISKDNIKYRTVGLYILITPITKFKTLDKY